MLRPGGELRYYEHVQANASTLRRAQQLADHTIWPMGGWMLAWLLVGLALFALAVAATVWLIRNMSGSGRSNEALRELDMRYARGELSSEEYDERRQRIHNG